MEFDGNISSMYRIDHIQKNEITSSPFFAIKHFKICMFLNDIHHKMEILDYRNHTRTYKCKQYLCKEFNWIWEQNLQWIFVMQGPKNQKLYPKMNQIKFMEKMMQIA
jgi:hypothetical protein